MSKHTPGPWMVFEPGGEGETYGIDRQDGAAVVFYGTNENDGIPELADARLIAAAPDLLEALQEAVALADANRESAARNGITLVRPPAMQAMYDKCVAAIAKATGEQQ